MYVIAADNSMTEGNLLLDNKNMNNKIDMTRQADGLVSADITNGVDLDTAYPSVTDRYYTKYYYVNDKKEDEDHCVMFHSNRITLITLAPTHAILKETKQISNINFQISDSLDRSKNTVRGKGKKGGQLLGPKSILCNIQCKDGSEYPVYSCVGGKLVEINENLIENPNLLLTRPTAEGFVAIVLPNIAKIDAIKSELLTEENYKKIRSII